MKKLFVILLLLFSISTSAQIIGNTDYINGKEMKSSFKVENDTISLKIEGGDSFEFAVVEIENKEVNSNRFSKKYAVKTNNSITEATATITKIEGNYYLTVELYNSALGIREIYRFY